ncbi:MAG: hypothetical protein NTU80_04310 [Verrucomicrobia bacterium]|nr:hypothetical protein [Verrucomicrobiota bacterium]
MNSIFYRAIFVFLLLLIPSISRAYTNDPQTRVAKPTVTIDYIGKINGVRKISLQALRPYNGLSSANVRVQVEYMAYKFNAQHIITETNNKIGYKTFTVPAYMISTPIIFVAPDISEYDKNVLRDGNWFVSHLVYTIIPSSGYRIGYPRIASADYSSVISRKLSVSVSTLSRCAACTNDKTNNGPLFKDDAVK